jgi:uncharacterized membrane protein (UPF0127 family)
MKLYPLNIKGTKFDVAIADTPETQAKGLSGLPRLGKHKGMLFIFDAPTRVHMVMRDMNFDLDFVFLDENWKVIQLASLSKDDKIGVTSFYPTSMILEVPRGTINDLNIVRNDVLSPDQQLDTQSKGVQQFKEGGTFEKVGEKIYKIKIDDIKPEENKLQILNDKGEVVANVEPGATIFSQEHTKEIIGKFKKGDTNGLVESILAILDKHESQAPDYVKKS